MNRFRSRKMQVFCIGAAKTGTTSIAQMFTPVLRSAHEPEVSQTTRLVEDWLSDKVDEPGVVSKLLSRDKRLKLELEASHPLGYLAPFLVEAFADAKFIITIREPKDWLRSRLNFHFHRMPVEWQRYRDFIWGRHFAGHLPAESELKARGLYSLESYLRQYAEQCHLMLDTIPQGRALVVNTEDIDQSVEKMCAFLALDSERVKPLRQNVLDVQDDILTLLDNTFVEEQINRYCSRVRNIHDMNKLA